MCWGDTDCIIPKRSILHFGIANQPEIIERSRKIQSFALDPPPCLVTVANEGLGRDPLLKI